MEQGSVHRLSYHSQYIANPHPRTYIYTCTIKHVVLTHPNHCNLSRTHETSLVGNQDIADLIFLLSPCVGRVHCYEGTIHERR